MYRKTPRLAEDKMASIAKAKKANNDERSSLLAVVNILIESTHGMMRNLLRDEEPLWSVFVGISTPEELAENRVVPVAKWAEDEFQYHESVS
jgi:hypothetical protein